MEIRFADVKTRDSSAWHMASITAIDSNFTKYHYDFRIDGNILKSLPDSAKADTSHYEWTKKNELVGKKTQMTLPMKCYCYKTKQR